MKTKKETMKTLKIDKEIKSCSECPLLASDRDEGDYCNHPDKHGGWLDEIDISKEVGDKCPLPNKE